MTVGEPTPLPSRQPSDAKGFLWEIEKPRDTSIFVTALHL